MLFKLILATLLCCSYIFYGATASQFSCLTNFIRHPKQKLLSKKTNTVMASNIGHCILHCTNDILCKTVNFAIHNVSDTELRLCELVEQDRYSERENFVKSSEFDHYGPKTPCESSPCLNGGSCMSNYIKNSFSCVCRSGYAGKNCAIEGSAAAECRNFTSLSSADRLTSIGDIKHLCDRYLRKAWYRFNGSVGVKMPETVPPVNRCNTDAPGWLDGNHPNVSEGVVARKVCFHWSGNPCRWSKNIRVVNCGHFYLYELLPTSACSLRYCTEG